MADSVRAAVLVGPGRYELQEFPYLRPADGALVLQVEMVAPTLNRCCCSPQRGRG